MVWGGGDDGGAEPAVKARFARAFSTRLISMRGPVLLSLGMSLGMSSWSCGELASERDAGPGGVPVAAVAPAMAGKAMYQGTQRLFKTEGGGTCAGRAAASMGAGGFCYLASDDSVKCAGMVGNTSYGMTFQSIGQTGAEQLLLMFADNGMCMTRTDHTAVCMGTNATALGSATTAFTRWTARNDIAALATGTWEQLCGITTGGQVYCGGTATPTTYGNPPISVGASGQTGAVGGPDGDGAALGRAGGATVGGASRLSSGAVGVEVRADELRAAEWLGGVGDARSARWGPSRWPAGCSTPAR